jgi:hypothetical protein
MAWSKLVDMELDDEDKLDMSIPCGPDINPTVPDYPWGLRISLTEKELEKLELDAKDAEIGDCVDLRAFGAVTCISMNERDGRKYCTVEIQLQKLAIENEASEDGE